MTALDTIMADIGTTGRAQWIEACRRSQRSLAETSAARPRKPFEFYYFGLGPLVEEIAKRRDDPALSWPIIRGLCAYIRLAVLDLKGDGLGDGRYPVLTLGRGITIENARILIRAELIRLAASRAQRNRKTAAA